LTINGKKIPFITEVVVVMWVVMAIIIIAAVMMARKLETIPKGAQSVGELILGFMNNFCKEQIGEHHGATFAPYLTTLIMFLGVSNVIAVVNIIPSGEALAAIFNNPSLEHFTFSIHPPTRNFNVTLALALMSIFIAIGSEFRYHGFKKWLQGFYKPSPIFGFIRILDYFARPMSLCFRLFGNILGALIVMTLLYGVLPLVGPSVAGLYFDIFDGGLQAFVFVFLTALYIGESVETAEE
jgi:F-type H+-transporting ATPase subunit a